MKDANGRVAEEILLHGIGLGPLPVFSPALATLKALIPFPPNVSGAGGIVSQPSGKILILSTGTFYEFETTTNSLSALPGLVSATIGPSVHVLALNTDAAGNLYYADQSSEIHRFDVVTETDSLIASNVNPEYMILDPSGAIFYIQQDQVLKIAPNANTPVLIAGNGTRGYAGDNGSALEAELADPEGLAFDLAGNLYIGDSSNQRVRKVATSGLITTLAGNGVIGNTGDGGPALSAELNFPSSLVSDAAGDLYVCTFIDQLRRIDAGTGLISTVAGGNPQTSGASTNKNPFLGVGFTGSAQALGVPGSGFIVMDSDGNLWASELIYPAQQGLYEISTSAYPLQFPFAAAGQLQTQTISLLSAGTADLSQPVVGTTDQGDFTPSSNCGGGLKTGSTCNISVAFKAGAHSAPAAAVTVTDDARESPQTIPVSGASGGLAPAIQQVAAVQVGASSLTPQQVNVRFPGTASGLTAVLAYGEEFTLGALSCSGVGTVSCTVPVTFTPHYPGLRHDAIQFLGSKGAVLYQSFLTGAGQAAQWFVDPGLVTSFPIPGALSALDATGNLYVTGGLGPGGFNEVLRYDQRTKLWTIVAGQSVSGSVDTGDGGPATSAALTHVNAAALDNAGNLFIAETFAIRRVDARTGVITTIAQMGGDTIACDQLGNVYFGSSIDRKVWKFDLATGVISDFAGNGQYASTGDGGPARSAALTPSALAFDNNGDLLISDLFQIRKVDVASGIITNYSDNCGTDSISVDAAGDLYLPCGELKLVPAGSGQGRYVNTDSFFNISGPMLRGPGGTLYTSSGMKLSPTLTSQIGFPPATVHENTASTDVGLVNAGNAALAIYSIALSGLDASAFSKTSTCSQSLAPGQECDINLTFTPPQAATLTAGLNITSTLPELQTTLTAVGQIASFGYTPEAIAFGSVPVKGTSTQVVDLSNGGSDALPLKGISVSGPEASDFTLESSCPSALMGYQFCEITVVFQPSTVGVRTATLDVTVSGSLATIPLSGSAYRAQ